METSLPHISMKKTQIITTGIVAVVVAGVALPALAAYEDGSHTASAQTVGASHRDAAKQHRLEHRSQGSAPSSRPGEGRGHEIGMGNIAKLLGMTEQELQTQLKSGKTLEQLAKEKGVTLPPRPPEREHGSSSKQSSSTK